ncbi:MAG: hypothetical protein HQK49_13425 [Oligoflexia bacterium]|nr:hypothetical protein [Oligoflexia bacterium]
MSALISLLITLTLTLTLSLTLLFFTNTGEVLAVSIKNIKGMGGILKKEFSHLAPSEGIAVENRIKNYYLYGDEKESAVKLIKNLFFFIDPVTLAPTQLGGKPGMHISAKLVGKIEAKLQEILDNKELFLRCSKNMKVCIDKELLPLIIKDEDYISSIKKCEAEVLRLQADKIEIEKNTDLTKEKKEALLKLKENDINKIKPREEMLARESRSLAELLLKTLLEGFEGKLQKYQPNMVFKILNHFLWKKAQSTDDFIKYFKGLGENFLMTDRDRDSTVTIKWFESEFGPQDIVKDPTKLNTNDYDKMLFNLDLIKQKTETPIFGTAEAQTSCDSFSDCGETSVRNFFNLLLFNNKNKKFEIERLEHLGDKLSPSLKNYYKKYSTIDEQRSQNARNDWAELVSNLKGVTYSRASKDKKSKARCEIDVGANNMLRVLSKLTGLKGWKELEDKLFHINDKKDKKDKKDNSNQISFDTNDITNLKSGNFGIVHFKINDSSYKWDFQDNHFIISVDNNLINNGTEKKEYLYQLFWQYGFTDNKSSHFFDYISMLPLNERQILSLLEDADKTFSTLMIKDLIFLNNLQDNEIKFNLIKFFVYRSQNSTHQKPLDPQINKILLTLFRSMPTDFQVRLAFSLILNKKEKIIESELATLAPKIKEWVQNTDARSLPDTLDLIINNKIEKLYFTLDTDLIKKLPSHLTASNALIRNIIKSKNKELSKLINEQTIINPDHDHDHDHINVHSFMYAIIESKNSELYPLLSRKLFEEISKDSMFNPIYTLRSIISSKDKELHPVLQRELKILISLLGTKDSDERVDAEILALIASTDFDQFNNLFSEERLKQFSEEELTKILTSIVTHKNEKLYELLSADRLKKMSSIYLEKVMIAIIEEKNEKLYHLIDFDKYMVEDRSGIYGTIVQSKNENFYHLLTTDSLAKLTDSSLSYLLIEIIKSKNEKFYSLFNKDLGQDLLERLDSFSMFQIMDQIITDKIEQLYFVVSDDRFEKLKVDDQERFLLSISKLDDSPQYKKYLHLFTHQRFAKLKSYNQGHLLSNIVTSKKKELYPFLRNEVSTISRIDKINFMNDLAAGDVSELGEVMFANFSEFSDYLQKDVLLNTKKYIEKYVEKETCVNGYADKNLSVPTSAISNLNLQWLEAMSMIQPRNFVMLEIIANTLELIIKNKITTYYPLIEKILNKPNMINDLATTAPKITRGLFNQLRSLKDGIKSELKIEKDPVLSLSEYQMLAAFLQYCSQQLKINLTFITISL